MVNAKACSPKSDPNRTSNMIPTIHAVPTLTRSGELIVQKISTINNHEGRSQTAHPGMGNKVNINANIKLTGITNQLFCVMISPDCSLFEL
jgi:hypothetical protein